MFIFERSRTLKKDFKNNNYIIISCNNLNFKMFHRESGKPCITWYDLDLHWLAPNGDLERDACRTLSVNKKWL
jgi:hypothetical protein